jgi:hypothetical protein
MPDPRTLKALLMAHGGGVAEDRWYCKLHDKPMCGRWTDPASAREQYERHVAKYHPKHVGKKPKIVEV